MTSTKWQNQNLSSRKSKTDGKRRTFETWPCGFAGTQRGSPATCLLSAQPIHKEHIHETTALLGRAPFYASQPVRMRTRDWNSETFWKLKKRDVPEIAIRAGRNEEGNGLVTMTKNLCIPNLHRGGLWAGAPKASPLPEHSSWFSAALSFVLVDVINVWVMSTLRHDGKHETQTNNVNHTNDCHPTHQTSELSNAQITLRRHGKNPTIFREIACWEIH